MRAEIYVKKKLLEQCEDSGEYWESKYKIAKAEAYKEFAERLKENACEDYEIYEKCAKNMLSFDYQQGYADYNDRLIWYIDNILKELVGDTNA